MNPLKDNDRYNYMYKYLNQIEWKNINTSDVLRLIDEGEVLIKVFYQAH